MNAINYLKFDLRIIKESSKQYLLFALIPLLVVLFASKTYDFIISYLYIYLIVLAAIPFSMQGNEKSTEMYHMFPAKVSSMVLGRFLYLIGSTILMLIIICGIEIYLNTKDIFQSYEILTAYLSGILCITMCFIQYPLYYKFGIEKGKILSIIIYLIPAFLITSSENIINKSLNCSNSKTIILISLLVAIIFGIISYLTSCQICRYKEM